MLKLSLFIKISLMIVLVILFSLLLNAFLNFYNFKDSYTKIVNSRYSVKVVDLKNTIESLLNVGLPLSQMENIKNNIQNIKKHDERIQFIKVFNDKGEVIFDTDSKTIGEQVPESWLGQLEISQKTKTDKNAKGKELKKNGKDKNEKLTIEIYDDESEKKFDSYILASQLVNNFNVKVGAVALGHSKSVVDGKVNEMTETLGKGVLIILGSFAIIILIGTYLFLRVIIKNFKMITTFSNIDNQGNLNDLSEDSDDMINQFIIFLNKRKEAEDHIKKIENQYLKEN